MSIYKKYIVESTIKYIVFVVLYLILLFPFAYMVLKSLMTVADVNAVPVIFFPTKITFENYAIFVDYANYFFNSFIVVIISAFFTPFVSCIIAYPLARYNFKGKKIIFALVMSTAMIPYAVLQIPQYFLFVQFGLVNKLASQFIGSFFGGSGIQIFLIIQFLRGIHTAIEDAAKIDGANKAQLFFYIALPLCLNVLIYIGIGVAIGKWNDFQGPLIYLRKDEVRTMAVAFYYHFGSSGDASLLTNVKMAMAVCMTVFPAILFFCFQKQMIGGIKLGAVKG